MRNRSASSTFPIGISIIDRNMSSDCEEGVDGQKARYDDKAMSSGRNEGKNGEMSAAVEVVEAWSGVVKNINIWST